VPQLQLQPQLEQLPRQPSQQRLWQWLLLQLQPNQIQLPALLRLLPINRFEVISA
jgi:hypothetical protein